MFVSFDTVHVVDGSRIVGLQRSSYYKVEFDLSFCGSPTNVEEHIERNESSIGTLIQLF